MAVLLDNLPLSCDSKHRFKAVFDVYNRSRHIPTHSKWEALEKKERRKFEKELQGIEREFEARVKEVASHIKQNPFGDWQYYEVKH
jgi:nicotinamide mononucleotide adenylyltransferase